MHPEAIVIGSDQTCACEGELLHKPGDFANACEQLTRLSGKTHQLFTAVCLLYGDRQQTHCGCNLANDAEARPCGDRAVCGGRPAAGLRRFVQAGAAWYRGFFSAINSRNHAAITGLPLMAVAELLRAWGVASP